MLEGIWTKRKSPGRESTKCLNPTSEFKYPIFYIFNMAKRKKKKKSRYKTDPISGLRYEEGSVMDSMKKLDDDIRKEQKEIRNSIRADQREISRTFKRRGRRKSDDDIGLAQTPPWFQGIVAFLIVGVLIWAFVPHEIIYLSIAIIIITAVALSIYFFRKRGIEPFINLGKSAITEYKKIHEDWKKEMREESKKEERGKRSPPLSSKLQAKFIRMAGSKCENPNCNNTFPLEVHHIIPRSEGGSNKENNLIVLCKNCHGIAQRGMWNKELLREWINRPKRFGY